MTIPKLSKEAKEEMKSFYVEIRNIHEGKENMKPLLICPRDLVNVRRLAEDLTKARKGKVISKEDAKNAIKKWKEINKDKLSY